MFTISSILIGAPRAQSTLSAQQSINETGALYKCSIEPLKCIPYNVDESGNKEIAADDNYNNENKDFQWLGGAIDGSSSEDDRFVVSRRIILFVCNIC